MNAGNGKTNVLESPAEISAKGVKISLNNLELIKE